MSTTAPLKYKLKWQIRSEIADAVCETPEQYGPGRSGFVKADLVQVADALGVELDDPTLSELYDAISEEVDLEPPHTAGNQWGLNKIHLKAIHRRVVDGR